VFFGIFGHRLSQSLQVLRSSPFPYVDLFEIEISSYPNDLSLESFKEFLNLMSAKVISLRLIMGREEVGNVIFQQIHEFILSCSWQLSEISFGQTDEEISRLTKFLSKETRISSWRSPFYPNEVLWKYKLKHSHRGVGCRQENIHIAKSYSLLWQ
jgi:hypothetical protein